MEEEIILRYIVYSIKNNKSLKVSTKNEKTYDIKDIEYNEEKKMLEYKYVNTGNEAKIRIENIVKVELTNPEEQKEFAYRILSEKYNTINLKKKLENFKEYYLEIIDELLSKEKEGTKGYINLNSKKKMYPRIFENLHKDEKNLLFQYFTQKKISEDKFSKYEKEILLIEQANLLYQDKKVLVVSILSALPLLYIAKNIIIVGDEKQLSAITNLNENSIKNKVKDEYNYAKKGAIALVDQNKGKYVEKDNGGGYHNERKIICIG